jgi:hypothetical protein
MDIDTSANRSNTTPGSKVFPGIFRKNYPILIEFPHSSLQNAVMNGGSSLPIAGTNHPGICRPPHLRAIARMLVHNHTLIFKTQWR